MDYYSDIPDEDFIFNTSLFFTQSAVWRENIFYFFSQLRNFFSQLIKGENKNFLSPWDDKLLTLFLNVLFPASIYFFQCFIALNVKRPFYIAVHVVCWHYMVKYYMNTTKVIFERNLITYIIFPRNLTLISRG